MLIKFPLEKAVVETIRKEEGDGDGEFGGGGESRALSALHYRVARPNVVNNGSHQLLSP